MGRKKSTTPTELELNVMKQLWDSEIGLTNGEIAERMNEEGIDISVPSVAQVIKNLLGKDLVKVHSHKLVSNVYARTFVPIMQREDYIESEIKRLQDMVSVSKDVSTLAIFRTILKNNADDIFSQEDIQELESILKKYQASEQE